MKQIRVFLLLAAVLAVFTADAAITRVFDQREAQAVSASVDTGNAKYVRVQIFSATTSNATVLIQQSLNGSVWVTVATITNPDSTGKGFTVPSMAFTRVNISAYVSGKITADIEATR